MYEEQTFERILQRSLERVGVDVDKREGSLIMNAIAPVSAEHANIYILLDGIISDGYADTANRDYLIRRCRERGIEPHAATNAVLKGKFNMEIPIGSRFNLEELNYVAIELIESAEEETVTYYYYQMRCETSGTEGNKYFGELSSIDYIHKDLEGSLVELLIPAEDEEDTEILRNRYLSSFASSPFGGNKQDYKDKTNSLDGVGGTVVIPVWNGGGTVKLIIIDSEYHVASVELVKAVQEAIDPDPQGTGTGIAPIGHTVTVVSAEAFAVDVSCNITLVEGYQLVTVKTKIKEALEAYFLDMRKAWENGGLVVRISQIENRILGVDGVLDVINTTANGSTENLVLEVDQLPIMGELEVKA
ncbi:baseplate J/gp47 family protein [Hominenteromicrobium sp.]|jgi:uncharacterized phage protein gp47/JayE|uniref:baseplate J/gp47 family protein n=1 Tax=Hominenteromicrobium sp. TaxID=3073581 RepID=UPI002055FDEB|nr:MAG TPA: Baseplate J like protein [Caudoviricetes sp.]